MQFEPAPSFIDAVSRDEEQLDLALAALEIARDEYPELRPEGVVAGLDRLAARVRELAAGSDNPIELLRCMNTCLFTEYGLEGNADAYSDPRNSYLNDVLERKLGIPISLSVVYLEVGWRVGLPLAGVSFPGHFLVKCHIGNSLVVLDPFHRGRSLDEDDLVARLEAVAGEHEALRDMLPRFLVGVPKREILSRMLRNLKLFFTKEQQLERALVVCNKLCLLDPHSAAEHRDRAAIYEKLDCFSAALADYRSYLSLEPGSEDALAVKRKVIELEQKVSRLN